jgi:hypothetical protein
MERIIEGCSESALPMGRKRGILHEPQALASAGDDLRTL